MSENLHIRAQRLLAESLVEGIGATDQKWLNEHLAGCTDCSMEASSARELVHALRNVPIQTPRDLAERTQMRVRLRAAEAARSQESGLGLWVVAAASWLVGIFSAPLVWRGLSWLGSNFGIPKIALEMGFVLWWAVPALAALTIVLHQRNTNAAAKGMR